MKETHLYSWGSVFSIALTLDEAGSIVKSRWALMGGAYGEGDVFAARVSRNLQGIEGFFVDFGLGKGLLPKSSLGSSGEIRSGDRVLVQVKRVATGLKHALLTAKIVLRKGCLMAAEGDKLRVSVLVSAKLSKAQVSSKLSAIRDQAAHLRGLSIILRSSSLFRGTSLLLSDLRHLVLGWWKVRRDFERGGTRRLFTNDPLREFVDQEAEEGRPVITNRPSLLPEEAAKGARVVQLVPSELLRKLSSCLERRIQLSRQSFIVLEKCELGWVVDVNTGNPSAKFQDDTYFQVNMLAAKAIFEQIYLRQMSGIIIVDFVNMSSHWQRLRLEEEVRRMSLADSCKVKVTPLDKNCICTIIRQNLGSQMKEEDAEILKLLFALEEEAHARCASVTVELSGPTLIRSVLGSGLREAMDAAYRERGLSVSYSLGIPGRDERPFAIVPARAAQQEAPRR